MMVLALSCALALAGTGSNAKEQVNEPQAAEPVVPQYTLFQLEEVFWVCDHASAVQGLDPETAAACVVATDEFRRRRFEGDFSAMLAWWHRNKAHRHRLLDMRNRADRR